MDDLSNLTFDPIINASKTTLNGREFIVADVVILKEGVLPGSKGNLFYPADEIEKNPGIWNGMPLTNNHPMRDGRPISGRSPEVWQDYYIGYLFNDSYDSVEKKRKGKIWVDVQVANKINPKLVPAILSGIKINVSTGLFTSDTPAETTQAKYKDQNYTHIARNYKPDHLAVLLDSTGACSVKDGCGINVNSNSEVTMERKDLVSWLTTNCACYKGKDDVLNNDKNFSDDELKQIKTNAEQSSLTVNALKEIATTLKAPKDFKLSDLKTLATNLVEKAEKIVDNTDKTKDKKTKKDEEDEDKTTMNSADFKANMLAALKGLSDEEFLKNAPDSIVKTNKLALEIIEEKKIAVINKLTQHIKDPKEKKVKLLKLKDKDLPALNELLEYAQINAETTNNADDNEKWLTQFFATGKGDNDQTNNNAKPATANKNPLPISRGYVNEVA